MLFITYLFFPDITFALLNPDCFCGISESSGFDICDSNLEVKIAGGKEAEVNEFPWAALLEIIDEEDKTEYVQRCGGNLINDRFVLTAAHCVPNTANPKITVILGEHDTSTTNESQSLTIKAKLYGLEKHWGYKDNRKESDMEQGVWFDFALIELSERVDFKKHPHIRPICLPNPQDTEAYIGTGTVPGWGYQNVDYFLNKGIVKGKSYGEAEKLRKLDVRLTSQEECSNVYSKVGPKISIKESNLCAVSRSGDSCPGDSGGGLVRVRCNGMFYELVGVVSFGVGCNSTIDGLKIPGVYGRVSSVVDWVKHKTGKGTFCEKPINGKNPKNRLPPVSKKPSLTLTIKDVNEDMKPRIQIESTSQKPLSNSCPTQLLQNFTNALDNHKICQKVKDHGKFLDWLRAQRNLCEQSEDLFNVFQATVCGGPWCDMASRNIEKWKKENQMECSNVSDDKQQFCKNIANKFKTVKYLRCQPIYEDAVIFPE